MSTKLLDLVNITKSYDGVTILDDLNLYIRENEFLTLLGPSGCGKTTTLRILGGFETPDTGKVLFNGQDITQLPPNKRQLNTVFQKYALFHAYDDCGKHRFWAENQGKIQSIYRRQNQIRLKTRQPRGIREPLPGASLRRPAAANRYCARNCQRAEGSAS